MISAAGLMAGVGVATPAHAGLGANLACGQKVTSSVTLSADIGPCAGDGLIVAKSGITLDLGGHTVRGNNRPPDQVGVRLLNVSGATVRNGTVTAFDAGVAVDNSTSSTVTKMKAKDNKSTGATNHGDGIVLDGSSRNKIIRNDVSGNGPFAGITMINGASDNLIRANNVHDNTVIRTEPAAAAPRQEDQGVRFDVGASRNSVDGNRITGNGASGLFGNGFDSVNNSATNNVIQGNGQTGVFPIGNDYVVSGNTIADNGFDQFQVPGQPKSTSDGVLLFGNFGGGPATVENNLVRGNANDGISLIFPGFTFQGTYHPPVVNQIRNNTVVDNVKNGIHIDCDFLADAFPNHVCLESSPPHEGQHVIANKAFGNGGADAGISAWDLLDESPHCDDNIWLDNQAGTAKPHCTLAKS